MSELNYIISHLLFINFRIIDLVDIFLVTLLLYQLHKLIRGTVAINIFIGIILVYLLWKVFDFFQMKLLSEILGQFISMGFLIIIVVFQQEIRKFLLMMGTPKFFKSSIFTRFISRFQIKKNVLTNLDSIIIASRSMANTRTGGLIIITKTNDLTQYVETGEVIDANLSSQLIENIFFKNSPMHDGAIIISGNKIKAARCILPLSDRIDLPPSYGLRHRAGIGVTEHSDAVAIIVSEQTGSVSLCKQGNIQYNLNTAEIKSSLKNEFK